MSIEDRLRFFVDVDCRGSSPLYERLGRRMLDDPVLVKRLSADVNPVDLFAAINFQHGICADYEDFRDSHANGLERILELTKQIG